MSDRDFRALLELATNWIDDQTRVGECDEHPLVVRFRAALAANPEPAELPPGYIDFPCPCKTCSNCGSDKLNWEPSVRVKPAAFDGAEKEAVVAFGCLDCSETLRIVDVDQVAGWLNATTPAPVPVAERLPGDDDCNEDGEIWVQEGGIHEQFFDEREWMPFTWVLREYGGSDKYRNAPWLPHWALPLPATPQPEQP